MGTCQGTFCALRAACTMYEHDVHISSDPLADVRDFLGERFKGSAPTLWGTQAQEMQLNHAIYEGVLNLGGSAHAHTN